MRSTILFALFAPVVCAAPPTLEIPAEVRPAGEYVTLKPKTDAVSITYVGLSGVDPFPSDFLKDARHFVLPTRGLKDGVYKFAAVAASATGEQARVDFAVPIGAKPGPIIDPPPPKEPPVVDPPTTPATSLYFLIVREDGPASPAFTKAMSDPAWKELRALGHSVKDKTLTEAAAFGYTPPDGTTLPAVVTLQETADGKGSKVVRQAIALPTTADGIRNLPKLTKGAK